MESVRRRTVLTHLGSLATTSTAVLAGCNTTERDANTTGVGVGGGNGEATHTTPTGTGSRSTTDATNPRRRVSLSGITAAARITPVGLFLDPGETVTFHVRSGPHSSRAFHPDNGTECRIPRNAEPWRSPAMGPGQSFAVTLTVPGTYDYYCATHLNHGRVGRLVVGEPGGPAEGSMPPGGVVPDSRRIVEERVVHARASDEPSTGSASTDHHTTSEQ